MTTAHPEHPRFVFTGRAENFKTGKHQRVHHFDLVCERGRFRFKVPKRLHHTLHAQLRPGVELEVSGRVCINPRKRRVHLRVEAMRMLNSGGPLDQPPTAIHDMEDLFTLQRAWSKRHGLGKGRRRRPLKGKAPAGGSGEPATILVCKASSCWKRGGAQVYERLLQVIGQEGLEATHQLKASGCMGRCKSGPNVKLLLEKTCYRNVDPDELLGALTKPGA